MYVNYNYSEFSLITKIDSVWELSFRDQSICLSVCQCVSPISFICPNLIFFSLEQVRLKSKLYIHEVNIIMVNGSVCSDLLLLACGQNTMNFSV